MNGSTFIWPTANIPPPPTRLARGGRIAESPSATRPADADKRYRSSKRESGRGKRRRCTAKPGASRRDKRPESRRPTDLHAPARRDGTGIAAPIVPENDRHRRQ